MTPASRLPIEPGERVLDLCAAPGGKATELNARLKGTGLLVANDISNARAKALLRNLELFGSENVLVTNETPAGLADVFPGFFDKILVDAPCSGEGMFRRQPEARDEWDADAPRRCANRQMEILALLGGMAGEVVHKSASKWGKWLASIPLLVGTEALVVGVPWLGGVALAESLWLAGMEVGLEIVATMLLCIWKRE